jgi:hypothetical protein
MISKDVMLRAKKTALSISNMAELRPFSRKERSLRVTVDG